MKVGSTKVGSNTNIGEIWQAPLDLHCGWVRLVYHPEQDMQAICRYYREQGVKIILVVARESLGHDQWATDLADKLRNIWALCGQYVNRIQLGNESDHRSPSSWTMTHEEYNLLLETGVACMPNAKIIGPGLVSGQPDWLDGIRLDLLTGIAVHPYGQRPEPEWPNPTWGFGHVNGLLDNYRQKLVELGYGHLYFFITEYGSMTQEVGAELQADYTYRFTATLLRRSDVRAATIFCLSDNMVDGFGMFNKDWSPKPAARRFVDALDITPVLERPQPAPTPEPPPPAPDPDPLPKAPPTRDDVIRIGKEVAGLYGLPERLMLALGIAESGLTWNAERWAYWDGEKTINHTARAKAAIERGDMDDLAAVIVEINTMGSNDISFGAWQQTVRWADEGDHSQTISNILYIRELYFDPQHAAEKAADRIRPYFTTYHDELEALCRYNRPSMPGINNPNRSNYERGLVEADTLLHGGTPVEPGYAPTIFNDQGTTAGTFSDTPEGVVLHGSRSGRSSNTLDQEFDGTRNFATNTDLGWNVTVGEDKISLHMPTTDWGWHARRASSRYLSVEFAQPLEDRDITDGQVRAFVWWLKNVARKQWPNLPLNFPTHAEIEVRGETGVIDGKTDVFSNGSPRTAELRSRIFLALNGAAPVPPQPEPDYAALAESRRIVIDHLTGSVADALDAAIKLRLCADTRREATNVLNEIRRHREK